MQIDITKVKMVNYYCLSYPQELDHTVTYTFTLLNGIHYANAKLYSVAFTNGVYLHNVVVDSKQVVQLYTPNEALINKCREALERIHKRIDRRTAYLSSDLNSMGGQIKWCLLTGGEMYDNYYPMLKTMGEFGKHGEAIYHLTKAGLIKS